MMDSYRISFLAPEPSLMEVPPQHIDNNGVKHLGLESLIDKSFCIVRNPIDRYISEYFYKRKMLPSYFKIFDINTFTYYAFTKYKSNSYVFDNHIKPQTEFILSDTKIYYFEDGFNSIVSDVSAEYGLSNLREVSHQNKSKKSPVSLSLVSINLINLFYKKDFEVLGYKSEAKKGP